MRNGVITWLALCTVLCFAPGAYGQQETALAGTAQLQADLERIAQGVGGRVGVAVRHIESGRAVSLNAAERYLMASTVKLVVAIQLLTLVDQGAVSLDKTLNVRPADLRGGSGTLAKTFDESRPALTLRQLLELMLIHSDNTATDLLWKEAGGGEAVSARLAALGIGAISVDRSMAHLLAAAVGAGPLSPDDDLTRAGLQGLIRAKPRSARAPAIEEFFRDTRDTATPEAMVDLLVKIWRREALSPERSALLLDVMYRCATGRARLKGMLMPWVKVAHKTGSLNPGVTNDVGIIHLPDGAGHIAIAVMIQQSPGDLRTQELAIAEIGRAAYRYFQSR